MRGEVKLGELLREIQVGAAGGAQSSPPAGDEWGVLRLSALTAGRFTADEAKCMPSPAKGVEKLEVRVRDVVMIRVNGAKHLVGAGRCVDQIRPRLVLSDLMYRLVPKTDRLMPEFLALALASPSVRQQVAGAIRGSSGQFQLPQSEVKALKVPDVSVEEQRRIVAAHEAIERRIAALERVRVKYEVAEAALSADALSSGTGEWPVRRLEAVATVVAGVTLGSEPTGDGVVELPYLRVANVLDGRIDTTEVKTVRILRSQFDRYALRAGDLLLTEGGDLDKLGRGAVWDGRLDLCLHQNHVFRVRCGDELSPDFLALYTSSPAGRAYFQSVGKQTTNLASINSTQVKGMPVPVPPRTEQERLLGPLRAIRVRIEALGRQTEKLRVVQQGLVEDLLRGRVRVPQD